MNKDVRRQFGDALQEHVGYFGAPKQRAACSCGQLFEGPPQYYAHAAGILLALPGVFSITRSNFVDLLEELLQEAWDDGNASGLDGWVGPGRGTEVDDQALFNRDRCLDKLLNQAIDKAVR